MTVTPFVREGGAGPPVVSDAFPARSSTFKRGCSQRGSSWLRSAAVDRRSRSQRYLRCRQDGRVVGLGRDRDHHRRCPVCDCILRRFDRSLRPGQIDDGACHHDAVRGAEPGRCPVGAAICRKFVRARRLDTVLRSRPHRRRAAIRTWCAVRVEPETTGCCGRADRASATGAGRSRAAALMQA